jgi:hypothetical protein
MGIGVGRIGMTGEAHLIEREKRLETGSDKWVPQSFAKIPKIYNVSFNY